MRYSLDLEVEPFNTVGIVDSEDGSYYFLSGPNRTAVIAKATILINSLNDGENKTVDDRDKEQILELHRKGIPAKDIATRLNLSINIVCLHLRKLRGF